jgi:hypothetical protein
VNIRIASILLADLSALTGKIEPGDILLVAATMVQNPDVKLQVQLKISGNSVMPPAPAIYNLMTLQGTAAAIIDAATALSASGPTSTIVEYPMLEADILSGFVRRRGLFVWRFAAEPSPYFTNYGYLVKIDRSGAGQLPLSVLDFEKATQLKNTVRMNKPRSLPQPVAAPRFLPSSAKRRSSK